MNKLFKALAFITSLAIFGGTFVSCSHDDDGGSGNNSPTVTAYTGAFSVSGNSFKTLKMASDGTYTMKSSDGGTDDSGTYETDSSSRSVSNGTYIFTSKILNGTFCVVVSIAGVTFDNGTLPASGTGTLRVSNSVEGQTYRLTSLISTNSEGFSADIVALWYEDFGGYYTFEFDEDGAFTETAGTSYVITGTYTFNSSAKTVTLVSDSASTRVFSCSDDGRTLTYSTGPDEDGDSLAYTLTRQ